MFTLRDTTDTGKVALGGPRKGESVEKATDYAYDTLAEAIKHYEKVVDWGFAGWFRTVSILDVNGAVIASKTFEVPSN